MRPNSWPAMLKPDMSGFAPEPGLQRPLLSAHSTGPKSLAAFLSADAKPPRGHCSPSSTVATQFVNSCTRPLSCWHPICTKPYRSAWGDRCAGGGRMGDKSFRRFMPGDRIRVTCRGIAGLTGAVSESTDADYVLTIDSWPAGAYLCLNSGEFEPLTTDYLEMPYGSTPRRPR